MKDIAKQRPESAIPTNHNDANGKKFDSLFEAHYFIITQLDCCNFKVKQGISDDGKSFFYINKKIKYEEI